MNLKKKSFITSKISFKKEILTICGIALSLFLIFQNQNKKIFAQQEIKKVTGNIDSVTLYSDRALVRRVYDITKEENKGILRFKELPQSIQGDSVRAQGDGVSITSVALKTNVEGDKNFDDHPIKLEIDSLAEDRKEFNDNITNYNEQLRLINSFMKLSTVESDKEAKLNNIKTEQWESALQFIEEKRLFYHQKIRETNQKLIALQKEINKLTIQLESKTRAKKYSYYEVEVSYIKSSNSNAKIFLDYMVGNVSWTGHYDLRGSSEGSEFKFISHATIRQTTGEEWKNVAITLSTARPSYAISPSPLTPWRLGSDSLKSLGGETNKGNMQEQGGGVFESNTSETESSETTTLAIDLTNRETIASDNSEHKVTLNQSDLKGTLTHVAIPSVSNFVYLKARLKNSTGMPILWSKMNVFLDGNFVGASNLNSRAAAGEDFEVFLGPDQRLKLKRKLKKGEVSSSGLFNKTVDIQNEWQIEVANYTKKQRQIIVYDQFPVPADPKISTKFLGSNRNDVTSDDNGILTWKIDAKPSENIIIEFSYSLSIPTDIWEKFVVAEKQREMRNENKYEVNDLIQQKNSPSNQKQYNIEKMLMKK